MAKPITRVTVIQSPGGVILYKSPDVVGPGSLTKLVDTRLSRIEDLSEPLQEFGDFIVNEHIPWQIAQGGTPQRYAPLSPRYRRWKERVAPGMPILKLTGEMVDNFKAGVLENNLQIIDRTGYARYHHTGTGRMPQRQFIQLQDDDMGWKKWHAIVRDYVIGFERFR